MDLNLQDIIEYLGQPRTKIGGELIWQCPCCLDEHKDNLHYNERKNILWCFRDDQHSKQILSEIYKRKHPMTIAEIPQYIKCQEKYVIYQEICNAMLLGDVETIKSYYKEIIQLWGSDKMAVDFFKIVQSDKPQKARTYLKEKRGINTPTIQKTGLGIDFERSGKWVIPIYSFDKIVGFEYRGLDFDNKKIWREKSTPKCLAQIYGSIKNKKVIICEGMLDGYILAQQAKDTLICTPSNGVNATLDVLTELQFNQYEKITLILDNDTAGDDMTKRVIEKYPFIEDGRGFLKAKNLKDVTDWFLSKNMVK